MRRQSGFRAGLLGLISLGVVSTQANADSYAEALKAIADTADRICGTVAAAGEAQSTKVTGDVKAQLSGLAKRLADLGITGTGSIASDNYVGILRSDLPAALSSTQECKLKVFKALEQKLIISPSQTGSQSNTTISGPSVPSATNANLPTSAGVQIIDRVNASLNALSPNYSLGQLSSVLSNLFNSWPGYYSIGEADDLTDALYVYCRSQLILERYINDFPSPIRQHVNLAIQRLIYMQDQIGTLFGPSFQRAESCRRHSSSKEEYANNIPPQYVPSYEAQTPLSEQTLASLRQDLSAAGLHPPSKTSKSFPISSNSTPTSTTAVCHGEFERICQQHDYEVLEICSASMNTVRDVDQNLSCRTICGKPLGPHSCEIEQIASISGDYCGYTWFRVSCY